MKLSKNPKLPKSLDLAAKRYVRLKQFVDLVNDHLDILKPAITARVESKGGKAELGGHLFALIDVAGAKYFDLKEAEEKLGEDLLNPFKKTRADSKRLTYK